MKDETIAVIDVEAEGSLDKYEPIHESIQQIWISAAEAHHQSRLNKSAFQRAMSTLVNSHYFPIEILRRGEARNTQYSQIAIKAILLLESGNFDQLTTLLTEVTAKSGGGSSIVCTTEHVAVARLAATKTAENLQAIDGQISSLIAKYREMGRSLGRRVVSEAREGFTEEVSKGLGDLMDS
jgi:hypothetical protein